MLNLGTISVYSGCSAGCLHCPYSKESLGNAMKKEELVKTIECIESPFILLTGGEPLEHPKIVSLLAEMSSMGKLFRIATGGHIPLFPFLNLLNNKFFCGFSIGTDILIKQRNRGNLRVNWLKNILLIKERKIHFSITITLGMDFLLTNLIKELLNLGIDPDFFTLAEKEGEFLSEEIWEKSKEVLFQHFGNKPIKYGFRNHSKFNCSI